MNTMKGPFVNERILVHLLHNPPKDNHPMATHPYAISQDGLAESVGISRAHLGVDMKKLEERYLVERYKAHTEGSGRLRTVYILTEAGKLKAKAVERYYSDMGVDLLTPIERREVVSTNTDRIRALERRVVQLEDAARRAGVLV